MQNEKREISIEHDKENGLCENNVLSTTLEVAVKNIIKREGYLTHVVNARRLPLDGGNYMAKLAVVNIKGETADGDKEIDIFVKEILPDDVNGFFLASNYHLNELYVYRESLKYFQKFQEDAGIPIEDRYNIPKFYEESNSEFIILENLAKQGFTTVDRMEPITLSFAEHAVRQLAKFHALSFVLKSKCPEYYDKRIKSLKLNMNFNDKWKKFMKNIYTATTRDLCGDAKKKAESVFPNVLERLPKFLQEEGSIGCLCHGDFRANNILMKVNDGKIEKLIPVDYQVIHYANPVTDLVYLIFLGTDQKFRRDHLENIKNLYHDTMARFLRYFDLNVEDYFPRVEFEKIYKDTLYYGFITATWLLPFIFADHEDLPEVKGVVEKVDYKVDKRMKCRIQGIVDDFIQWGYL